MIPYVAPEGRINLNTPPSSKSSTPPLVIIDPILIFAVVPLPVMLFTVPITEAVVAPGLALFGSP